MAYFGPIPSPVPISENQIAINGDSRYEKLNHSNVSIPVDGFRNKIINGNFDIWQRGTSVTSTTTNWKYGADRWRFYGQTGTGATCSRQSFAAGQTDVPGNPDYFLRWDQTTAAPTTVALGQPIENVKTFSGRNVTLTFYAKASNAQAIRALLVQIFGSGGSSYVSHVSDVFNLTTSWQKFTFNYNISSIAGKTIGTNNYIDLEFTNNSQTIFTVDIARVSLVEGNTNQENDPFSSRHIAQEMILCQRYYQTGVSMATLGVIVTGNGYYYDEKFNVLMRGLPTLTASHTDDNGFPVTAPTMSAITFVPGIGFETFLVADTSTNVGYYQFSWTADAEF